ASNAGQRVADWVLAQLQLMVPQRDKPVRAQKVAQFVAQLALRLPAGPAGTRVVPPEVVWESSQTKDIAGLVDDWLQGREHRTVITKPMRM
ncbi:MAG TPA: hypothetical protein VGP22_18790, partial [Albitalea sp.]|nr:hypothetical protein [Albitalea sp.]